MSKGFFVDSTYCNKQYNLLLSCMNSILVDVAFPLPLNQNFTYTVPAELAEFANVGCRVLAPFGQRRLTGFIVAKPNSTDLQKLRDIADVLDSSPVISGGILKLSKWISDYYLCTLGEALRITVPSGLLKESKQFIEIVTESGEYAAKQIERRAPRQAQVLRYLLKSGKMSVTQLKKKIGAKSLVSSLSQLAEQGLIKSEQRFSGSYSKPKTEKYVLLGSKYIQSEWQEVIADLEKKAPKQAQCLRVLVQSGLELSQRRLLQESGTTTAVLKGLEAKGYVLFENKTVFRDYYLSDELEKPKVVVLNEEQRIAHTKISKTILSHEFATFLLHGVTGSGKTQVYIEAIKEVFKQGRDAIVLVPEISLTPQTVSRFRAYFREHVAVLHSAMSDGERLDSWLKIKKGEARLVIGPRSAILAPLKNLGLIVVDEEHESSYKQTDPVPRYHARDLAVVRAQQNNAVVILGSATPSLESFYNVKIKKYKLIELKKRVNENPMPQVNIIDMMKERRILGGRDAPVFSRLLKRKIDEKIAKGEQVILLLNRRGFSSYIKCKDCGYVEECKHCNITLTYHSKVKLLRCHYCGITKKAPDVCKECKGADILFLGLGTQKVEDEIKARFENASVVRMDMDTTSGKRSHDRILTDFGKGKYNILLGTQMVAKGLDFSQVTLVGVINSDIGLLIPDFRAAERTFQLVTQVAGRAGRDSLRGEVIVQTYDPENLTLNYAKNHDFLKFFDYEISARHELDYPPFSRLICIVFSGKDETRVRISAENFARVVNIKKAGVQLMGPVPSPISKIQDNYRFQILVKSRKQSDPGGKFFRHKVLLAKKKYDEEFRKCGVKVNIDVDPTSIL